MSALPGITRAYIDTPLAGGTIQTHYRTASPTGARDVVGAQAPLVLVLHPSPMSSAFMEPVIRVLSARCQVIAPDTPGYGQTEPLPQPGENLEPYVAWVESLRRALGVEKLVIYGSATGAQIAIEYGRVFPDQVQHLLLDNAVHFHDEERADIMMNYFPDIAPDAQGAHFLKAWEMARGLFRGFPWYEVPDTPLPEAPLSLIDATALAYLVAGPDYARAYKAAFNNERAENLMSLTVPTTVLRWAGGLLKQYADRFDDYEWPENIRMCDSEATVEARFSSMKSALNDALSGWPPEAD